MSLEYINVTMSSGESLDWVDYGINTVCSTSPHPVVVNAAFKECLDTAHPDIRALFGDVGLYLFNTSPNPLPPPASTTIVTCLTSHSISYWVLALFLVCCVGLIFHGFFLGFINFFRPTS